MYMYVEKEKTNQRPCNTNGLELQCNLYGKNKNEMPYIGHSVPLHVIEKKPRSYEDVEEKKCFLLHCILVIGY